MAHPEKETLPAAEDPQQVAELAWLKENLSIFWPAAHAGFSQAGRGAIVIDAYSEPLGEESRFHYASQVQFEEQEDDVSRQITELVAAYDPAEQFVAVIIRRPEADAEFEYRMYQIGVGEELAEAVNAYEDAKYWLRRSPTEDEPGLEPPDLETLMEWENEGGCEAACPHGCWVEPDGTCHHGHPSWLLKLGLI